MKRRSRLKVKIYDEARLLDHGSFTITWWRVVVAAVLIMFFFIMIGVGIVWFTPLKRSLPGYLPPAQRAKTEEAYFKIDSLQRQYQTHQSYLDNLVKVFDTTRNPDVYEEDREAVPLMADSLREASDQEREFLERMKKSGYDIGTDSNGKGN